MTTTTLPQRRQRALLRAIRSTGAARRQMLFLVSWYDWQLSRVTLGRANTLDAEARRYAMRHMNDAARAMREHWRHVQLHKYGSRSAAHNG